MFRTFMVCSSSMARSRRKEATGWKAPVSAATSSPGGKSCGEEEGRGWKAPISALTRANPVREDEAEGERGAMNQAWKAA